MYRSRRATVRIAVPNSCAALDLITYPRNTAIERGSRHLCDGVLRKQNDFSFGAAASI